MKTIKALFLGISFLCSIFYASTSSADGGTPLKIIGSPKVYVGPENQRFTLLALAPRKENKFLLYFENTESDWDNKAILHLKVDTGRNEEYRTTERKKYWTTLSSQGSLWGSGYKIITGEVKGTGKTLSLNYSDKDSKKLKVEDIEKILKTYSK